MKLQKQRSFLLDVFRANHAQSLPRMTNEQQEHFHRIAVADARFRLDSERPGNNASDGPRQDV